MTDRAHDKDTPWTDAKPPAVAPLSTDHTAEVCVVGAGIAGLSAAYLLAKEGKRVVVLDEGAIGGGDSGLTTGHLTNALDRRWAELAKVHSAERLRLAAESHTAAIDTIERIVDEESIHCDFRRVSGYLFLAPGGSTQTLKDEVEAAHHAGIGDVTLVDRAPLTELDTGPAVCFPRQGQFHVLRYLSAVARAIEHLGGRIFTSAHVIEVDEEASASHAVVRTARGASILAEQVFLAVNSPFLPHISVHLKQAAYRTYAIALRVPAKAVPPALYWDTDDPFHYVRVSPAHDASAGDYLIVGGEDHRTGQANDEDQRHARLEAWARERFPYAGPVAHRWSGEVMETVDGLAYIGRLKKDSRVMIATGDCGNGLTHGTIAGMLVRDLVLGRDNEWASLYDPTRLNLGLHTASAYVQEGLSVAAQLTDWVTPGDIDDPATLAPGTGAIVRRGLSKLAMYRDMQGELHERSAVCPHLGCIVSWNAAERSWDCPCHGSRFSCTGKVMHGPATSDLKETDTEQPSKAA